MHHMPPHLHAYINVVRKYIAALPTKEEFKDAPAQIEAALQAFNRVIADYGDAGHVAYLLFDAERNHAITPYDGHFNGMVLTDDDLKAVGIEVNPEEPLLLPQVDQEI